MISLPNPTNKITQTTEMIIPQKYTDNIILWCVTVAAVIVAVTQFIYRSWVDNNVGAQIGTMINKTAQVVNKISAAIVEETK